ATIVSSPFHQPQLGLQTQAPAPAPAAPPHAMPAAEPVVLPETTVPELVEAKAAVAETPTVDLDAVRQEAEALLAELRGLMAPAVTPTPAQEVAEPSGEAEAEAAPIVEAPPEAEAPPVAPSIEPAAQPEVAPAVPAPKPRIVLPAVVGEVVSRAAPAIAA
ncbi:hypothetical protein NLR19_24845, partial [Escherichia coli]|nr:hypothetical protein [Escherichia coli]